MFKNGVLTIGPECILKVIFPEASPKEFVITA